MYDAIVLLYAMRENMQIPEIIKDTAWSCAYISQFDIREWF